MKSKYIWTPVLMAAAAVVGLYIGKVCGRYAERQVTVSTAAKDRIYPPVGTNGRDKMQSILNLIGHEYVDEVLTDTLVEEFIPKILAKLDPHSVYIPAKDFERFNEDLKSGFGGIGVQFTIQDDTIMVVSVVAGGPSSHLGVLPGDKIVKVNGQNFVGDTITNDIVLNTLRGEVGTDVEITVLREGQATVDYTITRGIIPMSSVDVSYVIEPGVGYMRIDRFAEKTYDEMLRGIAKLKSEGCKSLIVDLRSNSGGLLDVVINMCNEFLSAGDLIVYTEGSHQRREEAVANGLGTCRDLGVTVLIDEFSASASEIFAGAIQDNDRGTVIGRRSFGKGLVQTQIPLGDNSAVRLTIARYHTPSGRCIQRPYDEGVASYYDELYNRYESGELFEADSVKFDENQRFTTKKGRTVFGGGGIMPDIFVSRDTAKISDYHLRLRQKSIIYRFALDYADKNRKMLTDMSVSELVDYLNHLDVLTELTAYASVKGVKPRKLTANDRLYINREAIAYIGRNIKDNDAFYPVFNVGDPVIDKALETIHNAE